MLSRHGVGGGVGEGYLRVVCTLGSTSRAFFYLLSGGDNTLSKLISALPVECFTAQCAALVYLLKKDP